MGEFFRPLMYNTVIFVNAQYQLAKTEWDFFRQFETHVMAKIAKA